MKKFTRRTPVTLAASREVVYLRRRDLNPGDLVVVTTRNSTYTLRCLIDGDYAVAGGWFERRYRSPLRIAVAGCTWGGTAIRQDLVAARGMCLEFGNRLVTSVVQKIHVLRSWMQN